MKLWLKVTNDKYELPQLICDSADELAELCGVNRNSIYSMIGKYRQKKNTDLLLQSSRSRRERRMLVSYEEVIAIIDNDNFTVDRKFERIKGLKGADQGTYIRLDETVERFIRAGRNLDKDQIIYMLNRVPKVEFTPQMAHDVLKRYCEQFDIGIQQAWNYLESEVEKR